VGHRLRSCQNRYADHHREYHPHDLALWFRYLSHHKTSIHPERARPQSLRRLTDVCAKQVPAYPSTRTVTRTARPEVVTVTLPQGTTTINFPVTVPVTITEDPVTVTDDPVTVTADPGEPVTITADPVTVTADFGEPVTITADPVTVTADPGEPVTITADPVTVTADPGDPVTITADPVTVTADFGEPVTITADPVTVTADPGEPVTITADPVTVTADPGEPVTITADPVTVTAEPGEPVTITADPVTVTADPGEPVTITADPVTVTAEPGEPVTITADPVTVTADPGEPVTVTADPVTVTADPGEPVTITADPVTVTADPGEPVTVTADPVTVTAEAVTVTADPVTVSVPGPTVTACPSASCAFTGNRVVNGGFEASGISPWQTRDPVSYDAGNSGPSVDQFQGGGRSYKLRFSSASNPGSVTAYQNINVCADVEYMLTAYERQESEGNCAYTWSVDGVPIQTAPTVPAINAWTPVSLTFTPASSTAEISVLISCARGSGSREAFLDSVSVEAAA